MASSSPTSTPAPMLHLSIQAQQQCDSGNNHPQYIAHYIWNRFKELTHAGDAHSESERKSQSTGGIHHHTATSTDQLNRQISNISILSTPSALNEIDYNIIDIESTSLPLTALYQWVTREHEAGNPYFSMSNCGCDSIEQLRDRITASLLLLDNDKQEGDRHRYTSLSSILIQRKQSLTFIDVLSCIHILANHEIHGVFSTVIDNTVVRDITHSTHGRQEAPIAHTAGSAASQQFDGQPVHVTIHPNNATLVALSISSASSHFKGLDAQLPVRPSPKAPHRRSLSSNDAAASSSDSQNILTLLDARSTSLRSIRISLAIAYTSKLFYLHATYNHQYQHFRKRRDKRANELVALDSTRLLLLNDMNDNDYALQQCRFKQTSVKQRMHELKLQKQAHLKREMDLPNEIQSLSNRLDAHSLSLSSIDTQLPTLTQTHDSLQHGSRAQLEQKQFRLTAQIANTEKQLRVLRDDIFMLQKEVDAMKRVNENASRLTANLAASLPTSSSPSNATQNADPATVASTSPSQAQVFDSMKKSKKQIEKESKLGAMKLTEQSLVTLLDQHRTTLSSILSQLESAGKEHVDSAQRLATAKQSSSELRAQISMLSARKRELEAERSNHDQRAKAIDADVDRCNTEFAELEQQLREAMTHSQIGQAKLKQLTDRKNIVMERLNRTVSALAQLQRNDRRLAVELKDSNDIIYALIKQVQQEEQGNSNFLSDGSINGAVVRELGCASDKSRNTSNANSTDADAEVSSVNRLNSPLPTDGDISNGLHRSMSLSPINLQSAMSTLSVVMPVQWIVYDSSFVTPSPSPSPSPTHRQNSHSSRQASPQQSSRALASRSMNNIVSMTHGLLYATEGHILYEPCVTYAWCHRLDYDYDDSDSIHKDMLSPIHTIMSSNASSGTRSAGFIGSSDSPVRKQHSPNSSTPYSTDNEHARWRIPVHHIEHSHDTEKALKLRIHDPSTESDDSSHFRITVTSFAPYTARLTAYIDATKINMKMETNGGMDATTNSNRITNNPSLVADWLTYTNALNPYASFTPGQSPNSPFSDESDVDQVQRPDAIRMTEDLSDEESKGNIPVVNQSGSA